MRIEQLEYFLEVAECKNISQAADNLFVGQSTVSSAIIALEKELNIKLMKRTSHGVVLTPIGEEMLPVIRSMIKQSQQLKSIADQQLITKQEITLIVNPSALNILLTKVLPEMRDLYGLNRFQIKETYAGTVIKKIRANQGTIGITAGSAKGIRQAKIYAKENKLTVEVLNKKDKLVLYCNQSNKFAQRDKVSFFELYNEPLPYLKGFCLIVP
ncbi:LysR family transcriptional regulator [Desulforamulus ruminis]|uniref:LysR family transcriptional regulator n=1 Tax=Desulforamulus ruminis TaxID=1564 RepID=UPI002FD9B890